MSANRAPLRHGIDAPIEGVDYYSRRRYRSPSFIESGGGSQLTDSLSIYSSQCYLTESIRSV